MVLGLFSYVCSATEAAKLPALLDEIWQYELSIDPIQASRQGIHDFDDKLADMSPKALTEQDTRFREFLKELSYINTTKLSRAHSTTKIT